MIFVRVYKLDVKMNENSENWKEVTKRNEKLFHNTMIRSISKGESILFTCLKTLYEAFIKFSNFLINLSFKKEILNCKIIKYRVDFQSHLTDEELVTVWCVSFNLFL